MKKVIHQSTQDKKTFHLKKNCDFTPPWMSSEPLCNIACTLQIVSKAWKFVYRGILGCWITLGWVLSCKMNFLLQNAAFLQQTTKIAANSITAVFLAGMWWFFGMTSHLTWLSHCYRQQISKIDICSNCSKYAAFFTICSKWHNSVIFHPIFSKFCLVV